METDWINSSEWLEIATRLRALPHEELLKAVLYAMRERDLMRERLNTTLDDARHIEEDRRFWFNAYRKQKAA